MTDVAPFTLLKRNPDVLTCIANLSNDEVFTPPEFAQRMLDTLAEGWASANGGANIWADSTVTFLDPCTKSGVFLREIAKRLIDGLADQFPDLQARVDHIQTKQLFGIGITRLTALLARRSLYCSKWANGEHSVATGFDDEDGNVWFERTEHSWEGDKCRYCGAPKAVFDRADHFETHAYAFIHADGLKARLAEMFGADMQFDVIIGNPPYQIEADEAGQNIVPIYNRFVEQAKALGPRFVSMITPSRWMSGGKLDQYRSDMLGDPAIRYLVDYPNAAEAFPGVDIKGGVCYFLWSRDEPGLCAVTTVRGNETVGPIERRLDEFDVFVRDSRALRILHQVLEHKDGSFTELVSPRDPFGSILSSNFTGYHSVRRPDDYRLYMNQAARRGETWVSPDAVTKNHHLIDVWKVLMPKAGPGNSGGHVIPDIVLSKPLIAEPGSVCTLSHVVVGPLASKGQCESVVSYIQTRFFRFLVSLRKASQDAPRHVFTWVPQQKWDRIWTDEELFAHYGLSLDEQAYISQMIRPMEAAD